MTELYVRAVRLLARREHTCAELAGKLAAYGNADEIAQVLIRLADSGLQSDLRYTESYLRSQAGRLGSARLRQSLRCKGVAGELIEEGIETLPDELERARSVWQKKFGVPAVNRQEWAKQARFLQGRGFSVDIIRKLLKDIDA